MRAAKFSTEAKPETQVPAHIVKSTDSGSSFFGRLAGFLVGVGVGGGTSFYFIQEELTRSNAAFSKSLEDLNVRLRKLEAAK